ncbi:hypothetical protein [Butyrivibrio sp. XPD2006]|uniref:hypothetical protein n=1 Tax=Butyrivibrio sp. XPD2006 TaxID=1280668 RepID=UPI0003B731F0|nr:hypothetical protein [Butyrivibrio sp. XPD2006]
MKKTSVKDLQRILSEKEADIEKTKKQLQEAIEKERQEEDKQIVQYIRKAFSDSHTEKDILAWLTEDFQKALEKVSEDDI